MANRNYCRIILVYLICLSFISSCIALIAYGSIKKYPAVSEEGQKEHDNFTTFRQDKVELKIYYESLCPASEYFIWEELRPIVEALGSHMEVIMVPYGNAETIKKNGVIKFKCQHGPPECYGNKLHACAIDHLQNFTASVMFNSCMMGGDGVNEWGGSDDEAADRCAAAFGIDLTPIKACAKGDRGTELLKYYGEESDKADFSYVPYVLLNGKENDKSDLKKDICAALAFAPPPCAELSTLL